MYAEKKFQRSVVLPLALLLLPFFFTAQQKDRLTWTEGRLLTWDDFNGKPEKRFAVASTHYDIIKNVWREGRKVFISVEAIFFRYASWKKKDWVNDFVLIHEQKHFDIVELYARKLRKTISEGKFKDYADLLAKIELMYDQNDKELDKFQDLYDEESDGSMNGDKQREWNRRISEELEKYRQYREPLLVIQIEEVQ